MIHKREMIMLWIAGLGAAVGASAFSAAVISLLLGHNSGNGERPASLLSFVQARGSDGLVATTARQPTGT